LGDNAMHFEHQWGLLPVWFLFHCWWCHLVEGGP